MNTGNNIVGIYLGDGPTEYWDETTVNGGSENWALEISYQFAKNGFNVFLFGLFKNEHTFNGVNFIPYEKYKNICVVAEFDYFICSRRVDCIIQELKAKHIYLMLHECGIYGVQKGGKIPNFDRIEKVFVLSEFHKKWLMKAFNVPEYKIYKTFNGIDQTLYENVEFEDKKNLMIWSSVQKRGLKFFIDRVYPKIKEEVPDFKVKVCSYTECENVYNGGIEGIDVIGRQTHEKLFFTKNQIEQQKLM